MNALDREMLALMRQVSNEVILPRYRNLSAGDIEDKGDDDPVTIADRESEAALALGLQKLDPKLAIVGEEAAFADKSVLEHLGGDCWIIDPIDGTRNFTSGQPPFGIIVARAQGGLAQSGWLYDCLSGRFCSAHAGAGAEIDGEPVTAGATGHAPPVAAISLVFASGKRREKLRDHVMPHYSLVDIPFCAAEQYPRLALGTNDVSIFERTLAWDHAAGALWLNEAGGKAARPDGTCYRVDEPGRTGLLAAASPDLWDGLAERYSELD